MISRALPPGHVWLRLTRPHYDDPFDTSFAQKRGGRWNPPESWPTLYLNEDMDTVHAQLRHMFVGRGIDPDDLDDNAPILLAATNLTQRQRAADAVTKAGVRAVGLPPTYPIDSAGNLVEPGITQAIGRRVHAAGERGVCCRSAAGRGHELAWYPAKGAKAKPLWRAPKPYGAWRHARTLAEVQ